MHLGEVCKGKEWNIFDSEDAAASSRHYQNLRTWFQLFLRLDNCEYECRIKRRPITELLNVKHVHCDTAKTGK